MNKRKFDSALFWDVKISSIEIEKHSKFIIRRVLQYGSIEDWNELKKIYGLKKIVQKAQTIRDLDKKTATFLSVLGNVSINKFRCYTTEQSMPKHWSF